MTSKTKSIEKTVKTNERKRFLKFKKSELEKRTAIALNYLKNYYDESLEQASLFSKEGEVFCLVRLCSELERVAQGVIVSKEETSNSVQRSIRH